MESKQLKTIDLIFILQYSHNEMFRWHRIGLSVKGDSMTLIVDCDKQITKPLERLPTSKLNIKGVITMGMQISNEDFFIVNIPFI